MTDICRDSGLTIWNQALAYTQLASALVEVEKIVYCVEGKFKSACKPLNIKSKYRFSSVADDTGHLYGLIARNNVSLLVHTVIHRCARIEVEFMRQVTEACGTVLTQPCSITCGRV